MGSRRSAGPPDVVLRAGVGTTDGTWHVGAGAGQYTEKDPNLAGLPDGPVDPHGHSTTQRRSYGVRSRLSYRALAIEGADGERVVHRTFGPGPSTIRTGEQPDTAPGETFSNFSNTVKERSRALVTMPLAHANDALGYMPQHFEMSPVGQQGLGFFAGGYAVVNYEDSYAIEHCFGDAALEHSIDLLDERR